jgi:hypothetical protein
MTLITGSYAPAGKSKPMRLRTREQIHELCCVLQVATQGHIPTRTSDCFMFYPAVNTNEKTAIKLSSRQLIEHTKNSN